MKRRNREQRARMRTIQEFRLSKPYQRAMDQLQRMTGLPYRTIYRSYQIGARPGSHRIDMTSFVAERIEQNEDGSFTLTVKDTGKPQPQNQLSYWELKVRPAEVESDCGTDKAL